MDQSHYRVVSENGLSQCTERKCYYSQTNHRIGKTRCISHRAQLLPPPPTLRAMITTLGQLSEFRVAFIANRGSVKLIFGDRKKRTQRRKKPCAPVAAQGGWGKIGGRQERKERYMGGGGDLCQTKKNKK